MSNIKSVDKLGDPQTRLEVIGLELAKGEITGKDTGSIDAFGRWRVSNPYTILDTKQLVDKLPLFYDEVITGAGASSEHNPNRASTLMTVPSSVASVIRQTKLRGTYQPGKSLLILCTFVLNAGVTNVTKRVGYFDEKNGLFLQQSGTTISVVRRSFSTGSAVDTTVIQNDWNVDKMDGTGKSGITLDFTKTQILIIDLEWLGVGRVRYGFVVDGKIYYCHYLNNANLLDHAYMSTPNLPIRYEISNTGAALTSSSLEHICSSVVSEGGQESTVLQTYISRNGTAQTLANQDLYTPVLSLRLKTANIGTRLSPVQIEVMGVGNVNYEWRLILNPTIAGTDLADWQDVDNSATEYDITRNATNTITGGHILAGGYGASSNQSRIQVTGTARSFLTIGSNIDNSVDELVLCMANIDGNGGTVYGGVLVDEYN